jgi:O-antigen/teichoic acid export membrane protein
MPGFLFRRFIHSDSNAFVSRWLQGSFWVLTGTLVSGLSTGLASLILARLFSPEVFGAFGMVKTTLDQLLVFAVMGIGLTTTRFTALYFKANAGLTSAYWTSSFVLISVSGVCFAFLLFTGAPWLAERWLGQLSLTPVLRTAAVALFFISNLSALMGAVQGLQAFKSYGLLQLSQGILAGMGLVAGGYFNGLQGAFIGYVVALGVQWLLALWVVVRLARRYQLGFQAFSMNRLREIISFAVPSALSSVVVAPVLWHLQAQTAAQAGYAALGVYAAVFVFAQAIQLIQQSLGSTLLPLLLASDKAASRRQLFANYFGPWLVGAFLILPFMFMPRLAEWMLGNRYSLHEVPYLVPLVLLTGLFHAAKGGVARDLVAANRMWLSVVSMLQWALVTLVVFYSLGPSAENLALSLFIGYGTNYLVSLPFFIAKKVVPSAVYYNRWLALVWLFLFSTSTFAAISSIWYWRLSGQLLLLLGIIFSLRKMWYHWESKVEAPDKTMEMN